MVLSFLYNPLKLGVLSALSISLRCIDRQYSIHSISYELKYLCVPHTHSHSLQSGAGLRLSPGRHRAPLHWNLAASTTWNMKRHELSTRADRGENKYLFADVKSVSMYLNTEMPQCSLYWFLKSHLHSMQKMETDRAFPLYFASISSVIVHITGELTTADQMEQDQWKSRGQYKVYGPRCQKNLRRRLYTSV